MLFCTFWRIVDTIGKSGFFFFCGSLRDLEWAARTFDLSYASIMIFLAGPGSDMASTPAVADPTSDFGRCVYFRTVSALGGAGVWAATSAAASASSVAPSTTGTAAIGGAAARVLLDSLMHRGATGVSCFERAASFSFCWLSSFTCSRIDSWRSYSVEVLLGDNRNVSIESSIRRRLRCFLVERCFGWGGASTCRGIRLVGESTTLGSFFGRCLQQPVESSSELSGV